MDPVAPSIYIVHVVASDTTAAAALHELLAEQGWQLGLETVPDRAGGVLKVYLDSLRDAAEAITRLTAQQAGWAEFLPGTFEVLATPEVLAREDWQESWKRYFHTRRVSNRIVVRPPWEEYAAQLDDVVIEMYPGMSFGTGQHATTVACLRFLDDLAASGVAGGVLDVGCGSGILAIAAARLGFQPVHAFDCDPQAILSATDNFAANHLAGSIQLWQQDLREFHPAQGYRVVAANLQADLLMAHAPVIASCLAADDASFLLLAGILNAQYADVGAAYAQLGLREHWRDVGEEWTGACWRRA